MLNAIRNSVAAKMKEAYSFCKSWWLFRCFKQVLQASASCSYVDLLGPTREIALACILRLYSSQCAFIPEAHGMGFEKSYQASNAQGLGNGSSERDLLCIDLRRGTSS